MSTIHDLLLVHIDHKPGFYARIEDISPDVKPGWWQVKLLVLSFPLQIFTWILDSSQIDGALFTMAGTPIKLEKIISSELQQDLPKGPAAGKETSEGKGKRNPARVVSLAERRKN